MHNRLVLLLWALVLMHFHVFAAGSVTLAWSASTDLTVAGYDIYYGGAHDNYTNKISTGSATKATIAGLIPGATYYFVATTYSTDGLESPFSSELSYLVPGSAPTIANQPPTLNAINDLTITENSGLQAVSLSDITSGAATENQTLTVTATSSDTDLILNPSINYASANTTGSLNFTPVPNACGTAVITVTVDDGQVMNHRVVRTFMVTVVPDLAHSLLISPLTNAVAMAGQAISFNTVQGKLLLGAHLTYQWKFNGTNLASAIGSSLALNNLTPSQSGIYSVTATDGKSSTCQTVILTVYASAAASLAPAAHASGQYAVALAGVPGYKYVVEASTNLVTWVPVQTNTAPFTYVDANAGKFRQRFYRSVYAP